MSWWPSHVLNIVFYALFFSIMSFQVYGGRQPSHSVFGASDRRLLSIFMIAPSPNLFTLQPRSSTLPHSRNQHRSTLLSSSSSDPVSLALAPRHISPPPVLGPQPTLTHAHPSPAAVLHPPPSEAPQPAPPAAPLQVAPPPPTPPVSQHPPVSDPPPSASAFHQPAPPTLGPSPVPHTPSLVHSFSPPVPVPVPVPASAPPTFLGAPTPPPNANAPSPVAQGPPPPPGCCTTNMIARPGSKASDCQCVYPIKVVFEMDNASSAFTNLTSQFQHELASQLALIDIQVQIQAFQFGNNFSLNMVVNIGPLQGLSFPPEEIKNINQSLSTHAVHFSSILFSNYTVVNITAFLPPSPPIAVHGPGISPTSPAPSQTGKPTADGPLPSSSKHWHRWLIGVVVGGGSLLLLILACIIWRVLMKRRRGVKNHESASKAVSAVATPTETSSHRMITTRQKSFPRPTNTRDFSYEELQEATNNFSAEYFIGEGGFGKVYRGVLKDGTEVAIKKLTSGGNQGDKEFLVEVEMLSRLHHRHLVKLLGFYCSVEPLQQLLCYELVPNGSLESWLHGPLSRSRGPLDWNTRMKIALGAARGLAYLHEDSQPCVIHRDFKASNILLEYNFHAKVADFGLARSAPEGQQDYVSTRVMGTFGYVAPEYAMTGHLLVKSDVYSYGVVLLELLAGRKPVDYSQPPGGENIVAWARPLIHDRSKLHELADPRMGGKYPADDFAQVATVAVACVAPEWSQRPTMGEVVQTLKSVTRMHDYGSSHDVGRGMSSEGEREDPMDTPTSSGAAKRSFATTLHTHRPTLHTHKPTGATFGSDGSSSIFSSGPFSGLVGIENDPLSRTTVISEDLQEGR